MRFYEWGCTSVIKQRNENHVFLKHEYMKGPHETPRNPRTDCFVTLCQHWLRGQGGHGSERKDEFYCPRCAELAPIFETEAQEKEKARLAQLERTRYKVILGIVSFLNLMPIDDLLRVPEILNRFFKRK